MMSSYRNRLATRYAPFVVEPTYFDRGSANADGYRITLRPNADSFEPMDLEFAPEAEWIAREEGSRWSPEMVLYGPFEAGEVRDGFHSGLNPVKGSVVKKFDGSRLDPVMDYLFKTVDFEEFGYDE